MSLPSSVNPDLSVSINSDKSRFRHLALGGTFDRFHDGHKAFLSHALSLSSRLTIGITDNYFSRNLHPGEHLLTFTKRREEINKFIKKKFPQRDISIINLYDLFGPTVKDSTIDGLLVTGNTIGGAEKINERRKSLNFSALPVISFPLLSADDGLPISSSRIRKGLINRQGVSYYQRLIKSVPLLLPSQNRNLFQKPFGKVYHGDHKHLSYAMKKAVKYIRKKKINPVICVGDAVTPLFVGFSGWPKLSLVDLHIQRRRRYREAAEIGDISGLIFSSFDNPAGSISEILVESIAKSFDKKENSLLCIRGEEDLAVLPATLLAPLNAVVIYGHFRLGLVIVEITETKKRQALKLLNLFH